MVGSARRELLDHVVVFHERHLRQLLQESVNYYTDDRPQLARAKDTPAGRPMARPPSSQAPEEVSGLAIVEAAGVGLLTAFAGLPWPG